jgi:hypothetical protein
MIDIILSIIVGLIVGLILYKVFSMKKTIILNYNFDIEEKDKIRINNKCFMSN